MRTYARIDSGFVVEIIQPMTDADGNEIPIVDRFTPEFVATLVDVTDSSPMPGSHWTAIETKGVWAFAQP
ncbi:hypothetical protein BX591_104200 [Paraburkholderia bryophila]|uniref:Uncharacterized protein n=1 Tax=Paraburkholderia bryophila TaxID=420952 RepID=A0A329CND1_9BURK|nr:hypothetical protein BX591_104200 [Paraburkholderia bryophila]